MHTENAIGPDDHVRLGLPATMARWLPSRPWLAVEQSESPWLAHGGRRRSLQLYPVAPSMPDDQLARLARAMLMRPGRQLGLVVSQRLRASARALLEGLGAAYADGRGHFHLPAPGLLIHVEVEPRTAKASARVPGLGPSGVRAVQALLANDKLATLTQLASRVELSLAQTHTVLRLLEDAGMVRSTGVGPSRRRAVADRGALLDWLVAQPSARRREPRLDLSVYARRPEELWSQLASKLDDAGVSYAVTGGAGAALHAAGPTAVPLTAVRIAPDVPLERAAAVLRAEPTDRGANVRLVRDTGRVGTVGAELLDGVAVAPRVRVYIDALGEMRGEDIAQHFREVKLGY